MKDIMGFLENNKTFAIGFAGIYFASQFYLKGLNGFAEWMTVFTLAGGFYVTKRAQDKLGASDPPEAKPLAGPHAEPKP